MIRHPFHERIEGADGRRIPSYCRRRPVLGTNVDDSIIHRLSDKSALNKLVRFQSCEFRKILS